MLKRNVVVYSLLVSFSMQSAFAGTLYHQARPSHVNTEDQADTAQSAPQTPTGTDACFIPVAISLNPTPQTVADVKTEGYQAMPEMEDEEGGSCVNPAFALSVINPKEVLCPLTPRKVGFWFAYAAVAAGLYFANENYNFMDPVKDAIHYNNTILMGIIYGMEPLMMLFLLTVAKYPEKNETPAAQTDIEAQSDGSRTVGTAMVIPCHKSAGNIAKTIQACLKHFKPEQIFIADNANSPVPLDNTREVVHSISPLINYLWVPMGNKNIAQYAGSMAAKDYQYIMTADDDVILPENFRSPSHMIDEDVKGVSFAIRAIHPEGKDSLFVDWQDIEYKFADLAKLAEDRSCGVLFPHGAASFWDKETFLEVMRLHDTVFYAEDVKEGFALQKLGKKMKFDAGIILDTDAPTSLFGDSPNYYEQRVRSWEMGRQVIFGRFVSQLLTCKGPQSVMQKVILGYAALANTADWVRVPLIAVMATDSNFWTKMGAFSLAGALPLVIWKYGKLTDRPELEPNLTAILSYPCYKVINSVASVMGAARAVFIYWPNYKKKPTIPELEAAKDEKAVWLSETWGDDAQAREIRENSTFLETKSGSHQQ